MKLRQSLLFTLFLFGCSVSSPAMETPDSSGETTITLRENQQNNQKPRQRIPTYSPVYCQIGADYVTFFCHYEAVGEISITDAHGSVIITDVAELSEGFTVMLTVGVASGMVVSVTIGETTYSATI